MSSRAWHRDLNAWITSTRSLCCGAGTLAYLRLTALLCCSPAAVASVVLGVFGALVGYMIIIGDMAQPGSWFVGVVGASRTRVVSSLVQVSVSSWIRALPVLVPADRGLVDT